MIIAEDLIVMNIVKETEGIKILKISITLYIDEEGEILKNV